MVNTSDIEYEADGMTMVGRLAWPDGDAAPRSRPAVLVGHEGPGQDDTVRRRAVELAERGYVAFVLDYVGGGRWEDDRDLMMARLGALATDADRLRAIARAGLDVLLAQPSVDPDRVAAIGYCFGGAVALELARDGADLKAVVGFHASLGTTRPDDAQAIRGSVLVAIGTEDPLIPVDQRLAFEEEMRAGGVDWRMNLYGGAQHSFTNERADDTTDLPGVRYHEPSAQRAWRAMLDLFAETID